MSERATFSGRGWRRWLHWLCVKVYFDRVTVLHPERIPAGGPVLYLGLHRNGAVDGFAYHGVVPDAVFMVSEQLRRSWFARLFFDGIEVARDKDREGETADSSGAIEQCAAHLRGGGSLFIFPEGTSSLGPRHLPFKSGAARLIDAMIEAGGPLPTIVPVGIHYERAWEFRSQVEVVFGDPLSLDFAGVKRRRLVEIKQRIAAALEAVGANFPSESAQQTAESLAYGRTLGTGRSFFSGLKLFETGLPPAIFAAWSELEPRTARPGLLFHQGVPLFPIRPLWLYAFAIPFFAVPVVAAALINLPPLLVATWAGRKFPDGQNVIALWRILTGIPLLIVWWVVLAAGALIAGEPLWLVVAAVISVFGLWLFRRVNKVAIAVNNAFRFPALRKQMLAFHRQLADEPSDV